MATIRTTADNLRLGEMIRTAALGFAAKTGTAIDLVVVEKADAQHTVSLGALNLYRAIYANLKPEDIERLPRPGSRYNDLPEGSNELADIFLYKAADKPDSKPVERSFYVVWGDNTPEGKNAVTELDYCTRVLTEGMKTDDIPEAWMKKYASNPQDTKKRKKYLEKRRGNVRAAYKEAVKLIWQVDMVNELEGCGCELGEGQENTVTVFNKNKPRAEWKVYSVGAFLKLNPAKALEQGGSYDALIATSERGKKEKNKDKTGLPAINSIQTPETADKVAAMFAHYLDRAFSDRGSSEYTQLLKHLTATDAGKQSVHMLGHIRNRLNSLFKIDTVQSIYDTEQERMNKAA
jgi:hypothetical protein